MRAKHKRHSGQARPPRVVIATVCEAAQRLIGRLVGRDGWTMGTMAMSLGISDRQLRRLLAGQAEWSLSQLVELSRIEAQELGTSSVHASLDPMDCEQGISLDALTADIGRTIQAIAVATDDGRITDAERASLRVSLEHLTAQIDRARARL